jgi:hypothetical protein
MTTEDKRKRRHPSTRSVARDEVLVAVQTWRDGLLHPEHFEPNTDDVRLFRLAVAWDSYERLGGAE